jgi:hypothetical protein
MAPAAVSEPAASRRRLKPGPGIRIYRVLRQAGNWRRTSVLSIALFTIGFRLALSHSLPHPEPSGHDEFSYLLGADLFAHGHLAAAPHPLWKFFESVNVISRPVYAPKYPPAQSAFLAFGQVVFHDPFYGVLFSVALFAAAVCWMLQAYVRTPWALLGGICTALYFGAGHYWTESYWGGAVAGLGAALFVGAFGRLRKKPSLGSTAALGIGALLLVTSRPFESAALIVSLCIALIPVVWKGWRVSTLRAALPLMISLAIAPMAVLAYNYGVTGNALKLPYMVHFEQYSTAPLFWFQSPPAPKHFENTALQDTSERYEVAAYKEVISNSVPARVQQNLLTILGVTIFDGGGLGLVALFFVPLFQRDPTVRLFTLCASLLLALLAVETYLFLHYMAPLVVVGILLSCLMLDRLWKFHGKPCRDRILLVGVLSALMVAGPVWRGVRAIGGHNGQLHTSGGFGFRRAGVVRSILAHPGNHVVFVHFTPEQSPSVTWVANGADIDGSRLVWAHDRGAENRELQRYFAGRTFWLLEDRTDGIRLSPYMK